ncbi:28S ribosomal protein S35, mitochondrial [Branchiostoma belcheri]|nr:28S ribosomal protein S35, mitochondrial [Branchiostoma belcheri]
MFPLPCCLLGNAQRKLPKIHEAVVGSSRETKSNIGKWRVPIFGYRRLSSPCRNRSTLTPNSLIWDHYSLLENAGRAIQQADKGTSDTTEEDIVQNPDVQLYKQAVVNQKNLGESLEHVQGYKDSVKRLLGLN